MVRRIEELHMNFLFEKPTEYNVHLIKEFYANWDLRDQNSEVKIHGQVTFSAHDLNSILGTLEVDSLQLRHLNITLPYKNIRQILYGNTSMAMCILHQEFGHHSIFSYAQMNRVARMSLKIMYHCLIPRKHMTRVTRDRVRMIYALMQEGFYHDPN